jgi:ribose/xylose/arabinose/galactoside ABC-type transport system permease subunit
MVSETARLTKPTLGSRRKLVIFLGNYGTLVGMLLIFLLIGVLQPAFLSVGNLLNILRQGATLTLVGLGLTFVLAGGVFDISVGGLAGMTSIVTALMLAHGYSFALAVTAAVLTGLVVGIINGFLVAKLHINDFLATIAMMFVTIGLDVFLSKGANVHIDFQYADALRFLGKGDIFGMPVATLLLVLVAIVCYIILDRTQYGRELYAIGGNPRAAHLSGVKVDRIRWIAFILCALTIAIGGIMLAARLEGGKPRAGEALLGDSIAAASIGTTFLRRGRPHVLGTILGGIFLATLANGFVFLDIDFYYQYIVRGVAIIGAVAFSGAQLRKK